MIFLNRYAIILVYLIGKFIFRRLLIWLIVKKQSNYRGAWTILKLAINALDLKKQEFVRLEDLKRTLKVLEVKYIKGGETDESD